MDTNQLYTKAGWIQAVRQLAAQLPDPATVAALTPIALADATDPATTMAMANANKAKINQIIAALKDLS
ncbi:hypothetical protein [Pseudomonas sp. P8_250]|uniref:hypothetical protein n=1 Tax=Pseudomonas sp. P8_250 TaxID=3043446 RepID=UPI002A3687B3|nr:hypothetical protein [Pseudomonas sp. P8_250]MDX9668771.1 hypothetical protein [Pseudomonas sp. P8_250]